MSTKTLRKRIALVAVATLGAGVLSATPAFAGIAAVTAGQLAVAANGSTAVTSRGILSTNGTAGTSALSATATSTNYGVILSNGSVYATAGGDGASAGVKVTNGTISSCADSATGTVVINAAQTTCTPSATDEDLTITAVPNAGATSMTITAYTSNALTTSAGTITYVVVAAGTTNVFNSGTSFISVELTGTAATDNIDAVRTSVTNTRATDYSATEVPAGLHGYLGYDLKDAYGTQLSAHVLGATVTGGCLVGFNQAAAANTYTSSSTTTAVGYITVSRVTSTSPYTCTLTLSDNGTTVATRTFKMLGQVDKLVVDTISRVKAGSVANNNGFYFYAYDSAGNALDNITVSAVSSYLNSSLTTITPDRATDRAGLLGAADVTCLNKGTFDFAIKATNASLATITSPVYKISCAGSPATFTAALDKASYQPGDIATLTITAKDSSGNLTHDYAVLGTAGAAATEASLTGGQLTIIGATTAALLNAVTFTEGVAKFKFTVGAIEGNYNMVVDLPSYPNAAGANQAQTVAYSVKSASGAVSNADVLKAIVSLIASINKQIAALQKALLKK